MSVFPKRLPPKLISLKTGCERQWKLVESFFDFGLDSGVTEYDIDISTLKMLHTDNVTTGLKMPKDTGVINS